MLPRQVETADFADNADSLGETSHSTCESPCVEEQMSAEASWIGDIRVIRGFSGLGPEP
jgi:hypothetical protein